MKRTRVSQNGQLFCGRRMLILVVVIVTHAPATGGELFLAHRRSADFVLMQRDEIANDALIELQCALVLRKRGGFGLEVRDRVVTRLATADGIRQLALSPVLDGNVAGAEQRVYARECVIDGGLFECGIGDVHHLVLARHVRDSSLWTAASRADGGRRGASLRSLAS